MSEPFFFFFFLAGSNLGSDLIVIAKRECVQCKKSVTVYWDYPKFSIFPLSLSVFARGFSPRSYMAVMG